MSSDVLVWPRVQGQLRRMVQLLGLLWFLKNVLQQLFVVVRAAGSLDPEPSLTVPRRD